VPHTCARRWGSPNSFVNWTTISSSQVDDVRLAVRLLGVRCPELLRPCVGPHLQAPSCFMLRQSCGPVEYSTRGPLLGRGG
jgi:hypothetical protein